MKKGNLAICVDSFNGLKKGTIGVIIDRELLPAPPLKIKREIIFLYVCGSILRVPRQYLRDLETYVYS